MCILLHGERSHLLCLQLHSHFKKFNEVHKHYRYDLPESEILDIVDGVCNDKDTFNV